MVVGEPERSPDISGLPDSALTEPADASPLTMHGDQPSISSLRHAEPGSVGGPRAGGPIRIVLVEDVPEVADHVRELLRSLSRFKLVQVIGDGSRALGEIGTIRPDVVLVDSLLQGRMGGRAVVERLRATGSPVGIVALAVPDHPVDEKVLGLVDAVVTLPFGSLDLGRGIIRAYEAFSLRDPSAVSRTVAVFSAKGGVGKTTIAFNLAASLATTGLTTLLLDGSLQAADVRRLFRADPSTPSISDLPTDRVRDLDLSDAVLRHSSGVDVLLAPSRPELADLVTSRDLELVLDVLRRAYQAIVIDTASSLRDLTLGLLDAADVIIHVLAPDPVTVETTRVVAETMAEVGYPEGKVRYLVNRADAAGAMTPSQVTRALGRVPDYTVASDWPLVSSSNAEGVPFVLVRPSAAASVDLRRVADDVRAIAVTPAMATPTRRAAWGR